MVWCPFCRCYHTESYAKKNPLMEDAFVDARTQILKKLGLPMGD